jgi:hypothetical protein
MRRSFVRIVVVLIASLAWCERAQAIGWDSNDFLIGGGSSFSDRIGVFDHDLTFKGFLDANFVTVSGMDFDAQGRLVAAAPALREVRVYESNGATVGGFTRSDDMLGSGGDLKVAPDGTYLIATQNFGGGDGARQFETDGTFLRQLGSGWIRGAAVIPGNRLWTAGVGATAVNVFDLGTGNQTGTISIAGLAGVNSMVYSASTNTVLIATIQSNSVIETGLDGTVIRTFDAPTVAQCNSVIRGSEGDVFATRSGTQTILRWRSDGLFLSETSTAGTIGGGGEIVWAGNVPEPGVAGLLVFTVSGLTLRVRRR